MRADAKPIGTDPDNRRFRTLSPVRKWGYRVLPGDSFSYVLHTRPREWPIVAAHSLFGFTLAVAADPTALGRWPAVLLGVLTFVLCLNAGTLAINSAFDRDEGDIGYLDAPPPPPRHLFAFGAGVMLLGFAISIVLLPRAYALLYAVCVVMSGLYSVPPFRWKAIAGLDLLINAIGIGTLTALAGWTLAGIPLSPPGILVLIGFSPLFAALYPLTQLYQFEEDLRRGDRTLALALGMKRSLFFAIVMTTLGFLLIGAGMLAGAASAWAVLLVLPFAAWMVVLLRWLNRHLSMSSADHKKGMYHALQAWALTDVTVAVTALLAWGL